MKPWIYLFCLLAGVSGQCAGVKKTVEVVYSGDVGLGNEVCVWGQHPDLGGGNVLLAPKLAWNPGNLWKGTLAAEAGSRISYQLIRRSFTTSAWGNSSQYVVLGSGVLEVPAHDPPPWDKKTFFLQAPWSEAFLVYRNLSAGGAWTEVSMVDAGQGRHSGERLFRVEGFAPVGAEIEFVFRNQANEYLNAPAPPNSPPYQGQSPPYNFRTILDAVFVQDQQVFNYRPPTSLSPPQVEVRQISSTVPGIPGRPISIYLPRGYQQNLNKRYPVVYFHDGQNVFSPGGPFGSWDADRIATHEISQGRMREAILVAIPNGNAYGSDRLQEYLPNGDAITFYGNTVVNHPGRAADYLRFLVDNVLPTLDVNYRTLGDASNTLVVGSSMGGLASDFIANSRPDRFGSAGIFSPAFWAAPNYASQRDTLGKQEVRRFLSMGTAESSAGESSSSVYWFDCLRAYNSYLRVGHSIGRDLVFRGVAGGVHNEAAWSRMLPNFYQFALSPREEGQPLLLDRFPPAVSLTDSDGQLVLRFQKFLGTRAFLEEQADLNLPGTLKELETASELWETAEEQVTHPSGGSSKKFWRIILDPTP